MRLSLLLCGLLLSIPVHAATDLLELYKWFHANPELSFQEKNTARRLAKELKETGVKITEGVGGYGLVGVFENGDGPVVMLRADMDGLPVSEQTGLVYASKAKAIEQTGQTVDVMHACGHDVHMSVLVGTVRKLMEIRDRWSGTLLIVGQPAEERGAGARAMLEDGLFERFPRPDYNLALHTSSSLPAGTVGHRSGWAMANVDSVDIEIYGVGTHGAAPHLGKDPIVIGSSIVMALQTLVSREISPTSPAVVTVGSFQSGAKHNIISDRAHLQLTVRSYTDEVRRTLLNGIARVARNQARAMGIPEGKLPKITVKKESTPSLWNDPELVARLVPVFQHELGADSVVEIPAVMGGEDFARYGRVEPRIPSFLFRLGTISLEDYQAAQAGQKNLPSLHSPFYAPDPEPTLATGVQLMSAAALNLLGKR